MTIRQAPPEGRPTRLGKWYSRNTIMPKRVMKLSPAERRQYRGARYCVEYQPLGVFVSTAFFMTRERAITYATA